MTMMWTKRFLLVGALLALAPACGDSADDGAKVTESPNIGDTNSEMIEAAKGGTVALTKAGVVLSVPPGALSEDVEISATVISKKDLPEAANLAGNVIEFTPDGLKFLKPVALEIDLAGATIPEKAEVSIAWLDEETNKWMDLAGSKLADGKVTAETTHFTKFVIRFVINEEGDVVQESGQCDVSSFKPCGGDIEGDWEFTLGCATLNPGSDNNDEETNPIAKCFAVDVGIDFSGEVSFRDGKMTGTLNQSVELSQKVDKKCFAEVASEQQMSTLKPEDVPCSSFDQEEDDGTIIAAKDTGDFCELTVPSQSETDTIDGTYSTKGNTFTSMDSEVEAGETPESEVQEYCVQGDTLTVVSTGGDGNQFMIVATRKK